MRLIDKMRQNPITFQIGVLLQILYYDFFIDFIEKLKIFFRRINILNERKFNEIKKYRNEFKGKRCFIIATGPSLTTDDLLLLKDEYTLGVNAVVKLLDTLPYIPSFLGIQDLHVYDKIGDQIEQSKLKTIFVSDKLFKKKVRNKNDSRFIQYPLYACRHAVHGERRPLASGFSDDVSKVVYSGYSITYSLLQIAVYMGFTEIYLLGCDCSYDTSKSKQYFVESGHFDKYAESVGERMIYAYTIAKQYLDKKRPDVVVYNATRGGMLEVFPRKTLDEVFKMNK